MLCFGHLVRTHGDCFVRRLIRLVVETIYDFRSETQTFFVSETVAGTSLLVIAAVATRGRI